MSKEDVLPRLIIEAMPFPLLVAGPNGEIVSANSAAEDFFQASFAMLRKLDVAELFPFSSPALEALGRAREGGGVVNEYAISVGTPRYGGERIVDFTTTAIGEAAGHVLISIQRQSMAKKFDLQLSHQGAARSVSGMASMLAHEIKNPLAGIRGAAQLLEPSLAPQDQPLARMICAETDRIRNLVNQMEVFSDERPVEREAVNIHVVLERVKQLLLAEAPEGIHLAEEYDPSLPDISGSKDQLVQVFLNLAKNAVEAMGGQGGGTNPEQLFAAGYAACFQSALGVVSRRKKVDTSGSTVTAKVSIGTIDGGAFGLAVELEATIPGVDADTAQELLEAAHQVCPYSNATRGNIDVKVSVAS